MFKDVKVVRNGVDVTGFAMASRSERETSRE
jgi:hypothetical protein